MDLRGRTSLQCYEAVIPAQPCPHKEDKYRFLCLMGFLIWMSTWNLLYQLHQKTAVHGWFLYTCSVPWTSSLFKQPLPGKQNLRGHGRDLAGWWYWCLSGHLSRKFPVCVTQVYLAGNTWAHTKSISGEKPQAGYLCWLESHLPLQALFYNSSTCIKDNSKAVASKQSASNT